MTLQTYDDDSPIDEKGILKDGRRVRVPLMMRDSANPVQRSIASYVDARRTAAPAIRDAYEQYDEYITNAWRGGTAQKQTDAMPSPHDVRLAKLTNQLADTEADLAAIRRSLVAFDTVHSIARDRGARTQQRDPTIASLSGGGSGQLTGRLGAMDAREAAYAEYDREVANAWCNR